MFLENSSRWCNCQVRTGAGKFPIEREVLDLKLYFSKFISHELSTGTEKNKSQSHNYIYGILRNITNLQLLKLQFVYYICLYLSVHFNYNETKRE